MNTDQIIKLHPLPWQHVVVGMGQTKMLDSNHQEVPLFTMLNFLTELTARLAREMAQFKTPEPEVAAAPL